MVPPAWEEGGGGEPPAEASAGMLTCLLEQRRAQHARSPRVRWLSASARLRGLAAATPGASTRRHQARPPRGHDQGGAKAEEAGGSEQLRAARKKGKEKTKRKKGEREKGEKVEKEKE